MADNSDGRDFETKITADPSGFQAGFQKAVGFAQAGSNDIQRSVRGVGAAFDSVRASVLGLGSLFAGGLFGAIVKQQVALQDEFSKSAQKSGVLTEAFSATAYAAKLADLSNEDLTKTYAKLSAALTDAQQGQREQVELFKRLRLDPKNIQDADELLLKLAEKFADMDDGARKTALAIDIFGEKLGPRLIPFLNAGRDGLEALRREAQDLGIAVSTEAGVAAEKFNDTLTTLGAMAQGAAMQIANQLLPALQAIADEAKASGDGVKLAGKAFRIVFETIAVLGANVAFVITGIGREAGAMAAQLSALARLDFTGFRVIGDAVKADAARARAELDAFERRVMGLADTGFGSKSSEDRGFVPKAAPRPGDVGDKAVKGPAAPAPESRMAQWEAQLAQKKLALEREGLAEGQQRQLSKAQELAYWSELLALKDLSKKEETALTRRAAETGLEVVRQKFEQEVAVLEAEAGAFRNNMEERLRIERQIQGKYEEGSKGYEAAQRRIVEVQRQAAEQEQAVRESRAEAERGWRLQGIALEEQAVQQSLQLGLISQADALAAQLEFEARRTAIAREALDQRMADAMLDRDKNKVEIERINREIEQLQQQHELRMRGITNESERESPLGKSMQSLQDGMQRVGQALLTNWRTVGSALRGVLASIGQTIITETIVKPLAAKAAAWIRERAMTLFGIGAKAAEAGAGAAAAVAATPVVGPALALAALATVFAAVSGMSSNVPSFSAAGGFDIPSNINPIVQTHAREMVLPAKQADVIRGLADGGLAAGGGGGVQVHLNVQALDGASVRRVLMDNTQHLVDALGNAQRQFMRPR